MLTLLFSEYVSHEETRSLVVPAQDYLIFFLSPITFPHILHTSAISHKYPELLTLGEGRFEICSPIYSLGCLVRKPFLCCKARHLSTQLAASRANKPGLVTPASYGIPQGAFSGFLGGGNNCSKWMVQISHQYVFSQTVPDGTRVNSIPWETGAGKSGSGSWLGALLEIYPFESKREEDSRPSWDRLSIRKRRQSCIP